jgi:hypothetical protein
VPAPVASPEPRRRTWASAWALILRVWAATRSSSWRTLALATAAALAGSLSAPVAAGASETAATIRPSFSPDRLGAKAAFTFSVNFSGGALGVPSPVRKAIVHFPLGLSMNIPRLRACPRARLQAHGARGCPAQALVGVGHAVAAVHAGAGVEREDARVWAFLGPPQGVNPTIELLGEGYTPLLERVVITGVARPDRPPYGEELVMSIPAIPSIPYEPNASTVSFTMTVGGSRFRRHSPNTVLLPTTCPAGGFPFAADFTYEDGSTSTAQATVPCP